jgi:hypothetical protein
MNWVPCRGRRRATAAPRVSHLREPQVRAYSARLAACTPNPKNTETGDAIAISGLEYQSERLDGGGRGPLRALVPSRGRRRTDDPPSFSGASRSSWRQPASSASSSPLPSPWSSLLPWPCVCPLSFSLSCPNHSDKRTLTNFEGLVDSEGRFSERIYEFSNARVAASPQFS